MKLINLFESVSSVLYHYSSVHSVASILKNGMFRLSASVGTDTERNMQPRDKFYYLSTTRSKRGDYTVSSSYRIGVVLELNGDWFNHRYKGGPVDYWGPAWKTKHRSEAEDRIFSPTPNIDLPENYTDVIIAIHFLDATTNQDRHPVEMKMVREMLKLAKIHEIPAYMYNTVDSFLLQNKVKSVPITKEYINSLVGEPVPPSTRLPRDVFEPWRELYHKSSKAELSDDARRVLRNYIQGWRTDDGVRMLSSDIHNMKSKGDPGLAKLLVIFKKLKFTSPKEYVEYLVNKWKDG